MATSHMSVHLGSPPHTHTTTRLGVQWYAARNKVSLILLYLTLSPPPQGVTGRPWQSASHLPVGTLYGILEKRFPLAHWMRPWQSVSHLPTSSGVLGKALPTCPLDASLAKRFPLAYWRSYDVFGNALPTHLPIEDRMASLARRFPPAYWTSYGVIGKAFPTCRVDIVWRP